MAGDRRKLLCEIERTLKKVQEGVEVFDGIWNKLHDTENANQKDKYETDLKKEIKKLQRYRDQIKTWAASSEVKDKKPLLDARKVIEREMERFKVCEKETKTKAFSKEGLSQAAKLDPKARAKRDARQYLSDTVDELNTQVDNFEAEIEGLQGGKKTKGKAPPRLTHLEESVSRHKEHTGRLEQVMRLLENDQLSPEDVNDLKELVDDYLERNQECFDEFTCPDDLYEGLDLDTLDACKGAGETLLGTANKPSVAEKSVVHLSLDTLPESGAREDSTSRSKGAQLSAAVRQQQNSIGNKLGTPVSALMHQPSGPLTTASPRSAYMNLSLHANTSQSMPPLPLGPPPQQRQPAVQLQQQQQQQTSIQLAYHAQGMQYPNLRQATQTQYPSHPSHQVHHSHIQTIQNTNTMQRGPSQEARFTSNSHIFDAHFGTKQMNESAHKTTWAAQPGARSMGVETHLASGSEWHAQRVDLSFDHKHQISGRIHRNHAGPVSSVNHTSNISPMAAVTYSHAQGSGRNDAGNSLFDSVSQTNGKGLPATRQDDTQERLNSDASEMFLALHELQKLSQQPGDLRDRATQLHMVESCYRTALQPTDCTWERRRRLQNVSKKIPSFPATQPCILENRTLFERLDSDALFFSFYFLQGTTQQYLAAQELRRTQWRFHKKYNTWFARQEEPKGVTEDHEHGSYVYFDFNANAELGSLKGWCQRVKKDFVFEYCHLEDDIRIDTAPQPGNKSVR
mmetsp:Transcript_10710/g.37183  ORF Transcript_10710/g.37183 Transcript_10710/m.37183 type:complete len:738 (-) Transcript_10710:1025-3238(-)|eukprot:CAMPEP_0183793364 /NCGR_PEP_ID=MMETSP0803_2-20130417/3165_1 /TAXON_ID=195967 /ORGANISM="Crustomastix stigmata, Strain CCMP3273" /LENGTH=737 /DNA_ID=CAMNT_0026037739 /DNA_START=105 /DNA_END=2318 /DNA_ORIENTATION=-